MKSTSIRDQHFGTVCQLGFVVSNIHDTMRQFTRAIGAGPWFLAERVELNAIYREAPIRFSGSMAFANTGSMQIELICQADDAPSIFTELVDTKGYGLHHQGIIVPDFDAQLQIQRNMGHDVAYYCVPGSRIAMIDTHGSLPFFLELLEAGEELENMFSKVYRASVDWAGEDPIRDFAEI